MLKRLAPSVLFMVALLAMVGTVVAQEPEPSSPPAAAVKPAIASRPGETRQQTLDRMGLKLDPGDDPDPKAVFIRFAGAKFHIDKFDREHTAPPLYPNMNGWIRPQAFTSFAAEIYQETPEYVWVFLPIFEPRKARIGPDGKPINPKKMTIVQLDYFKKYAEEFPLVTPPDSGKVLHLTESSKGLPVEGNWRDFVAIADMNGDGNLDIIAPPQRGPENVPAIFLGDGKGGWKQWTDVKWPATFNYGSAAAADLDGDGHQDLVFGAHMTGIFAMLGDGKGNFRSFDEGLPKDYATRRVRIADVNGDGRPDIIALCEGPVRLQALTGKAQPKLRVFLNQKTKWTEMPLVGPEERQLGDRWLEVTDLNGDGKPDFVGSSNILSGPDLMFISDKKGWNPFGRGYLPWYSTYSALVAGHFTSKKKSDAILGFSRTFSREIDPDKVTWPANLDISGIERLSWARDGKVTRVPIARWPGGASPGAMAAADLDGDGNLDIVYFAEPSKGFIVLLGDGKGGFRSARIEGLPKIDNLPVDVEVADVNKDGRPDLIIVYQEHEGRGDSSIRVFLNDGVR